MTDPDPRDAILLELRALVARLLEQPDPRAARATALGSEIAAFLGGDEYPITRFTAPAHRLVDVARALEAIAAADADARRFGVSGGPERQHETFAGLLRHRYSEFAPGPVDLEAAATGFDRVEQVTSFAVHLFRFGGTPVAALLRAADPQQGRTAVAVELISADPAVGAAVVDRLSLDMNAGSVLRGQVLGFAPDEFGHGLGKISFLPRPTVADDDLVLPDGVLERIGAHVVGIGRHRDALRRFDQHLKRGLLLFGPPGTGKTHTVRWLLGTTPDRTAIVLQGGSLGYVAEAAKLARAMTPAILVFEDVDLVAVERGMFGGPQPLLYEILDALDGIGGDADIAFVLTTNRVDLLEPALAARPGRVDLALEIGLPDRTARRRLIDRYSAELAFSDAARSDAADRTDGTTASFARELVRRTVLRAAGEERDPTDDDLRVVLDELLATSAALTRAMLGSPDQNRVAGPDGETIGADGATGGTGVFGTYAPPPG